MPRLYDLLPNIYRHRDLFEQHQLEALLNVLQYEFDLLEEDIATLYDNWFIESCADWVVPYIGQLIGVNIEVHDVTQRGRIADTLIQRARKGTRGALHEIAALGTGWSVQVMPFVQQLSTTQSMIQPDIRQGRTANISSDDILKVKSAFDPNSYTVTINSSERPVSTDQGYATPSDLHRSGVIGLHVWRLALHVAVDVMACPVDKQRFLIHPLGVDTILYHLPHHGYELLNLPHAAPDPSDVLRTLPARERTELYRWLPETPPFVQIRVGDQDIAAQDIQFVALRDTPKGDAWQLVVYPGVANKPRVYVDPLRGRVYFPKPPTGIVRTSFVYGLSGDLGGGAYERKGISHGLTNEAGNLVWQAYVGSQLAEGIPNTAQFKTFEAAVQAWQNVNQHGVIHFVDSDRYGSFQKPVTITCNGGYRLVIEAAPGQCPVIVAPVTIQAPAMSSLVALSGLWLDAPLTLSGSLTLYMEHCTLNPPRGNKPQPALMTSQIAECAVMITKSIVGAIQLPATVNLRIEDSVVHGGPDGAIYAAPSMAAQPSQRVASAISSLERTTVWGRVEVEKLVYASDVLFTDEIVVHQSESGGLRFCYLPAQAQTPSQYFCQTAQNGMRPQYMSRTYGHPAYAQLSLNTPHKVLEGGSDGSEMGAFHNLYQAQRRKTLTDILDEFIPAHLKPVVVFVD